MRCIHFKRRWSRRFTRTGFSICKIPRQSGKSTTVCSYILWHALFNPTVNCAILANKAHLLETCLQKYICLTKHCHLVTTSIKEWNKGSIVLENDSKIIASSTSSSAVRGGSYNLVFLDEFAFVPFNLAEDFLESVYPTITSSKNTKVMQVVSTPNGMNHFYKMWVDAEEKRSNYATIEVEWNDIPGRVYVSKKRLLRTHHKNSGNKSLNVSS